MLIALQSRSKAITHVARQTTKGESAKAIQSMPLTGEDPEVTEFGNWLPAIMRGARGKLEGGTKDRTENGTCLWKNASGKEPTGLREDRVAWR